MPRYSLERRQSVLGKLLAPQNRPVPQVAAAEGISEATLYNWLTQARRDGVPVPGSRSKTADDWSDEAKFAAVIETQPMNDSELSEYCRQKGLYPEQIPRTRHWRRAQLYWCYQKSSRRCGRTRINDRPCTARTHREID